MPVVQFVENNTVVLTQLLEKPPSENENIKIKGRKGKVSTIKITDDNVVYVYVIFDKVVKNNPANDPKKKKR
ncbi:MULTISPECIES: hypothetical protein [Metabacillus]|uniref:Preprotein translocase subunit SecA n=1 Tax=Metabacillus endolithicus TaxID=1535204 RepID=A0ABW5BSI6_9BACI|nr:MULTISPECIES: hypothetical protein [Metabacillus]MCM3163362.1 hypothetical protein [Metabacillus litoralis]MCM3409454.1 hypothetical protein [Metabacillus litoralis]UHA58952.1 hypothetical protein KDJ21_019310 [Metabacillus litoralis]UPG63565.1 hypothetical protein MVE64_25550 [Metabacillus endolithicus]